MKSNQRRPTECKSSKQSYVKIYDKGKHWHGLRVYYSTQPYPTHKVIVPDTTGPMEHVDHPALIPEKTVTLHLWKIKVTRRSGRVTHVMRYTHEASFAEI